MKGYELTERLFSTGPVYEVRASGSPRILYTVHGALLSLAPTLTAHHGDRGPELARLRANFTKTRFTIDGLEPATLAFPLTTAKSKMSLAVRGREYTSDAGFFAGRFRCVDPDGQAAFEIAKLIPWRDRLWVEIHLDLPELVVLLAAVAVDQKYFQDEVIPASA